MSPRDRLTRLRKLRDEITREINEIQRLGGARATTEDDDVRAIMGQIAAAYGVTVEQVVSRSRLPTIVTARQETAWYLRQQQLSYPEIGRLLGRDHTTVMASIRKIEAKGLRPRLIRGGVA